jgi:eukaryotic-like serine/threonine-protein kinase
MPGLELGGARYQIRDLAGRGGMADVFRALDRATGETVALKRLRACDPAARERFEREARLLCEIRHPAILRYLDHGVGENGEPYLVTEWLAGETLHKRLSRGPIDDQSAIALALTIADALGALHERGVIHRDVTASNIVITGPEDHDVKLIDLGIAGELEGPELTVEGQLIGTPAYLPPERVRGARRLDPSSDVYGLACVLFRCLAGRLPYTGRDATAVLTKIILEPVPRLGDVRAGAHPALEELLLRALAKDPKDRPRDARSARSELEQAVRAMRERPEATRSALTAIERRLLILIVARLGGPRLTSPEGDTAERSPPHPIRALSATLEPLGARFHTLVDGTFVAALAGSQPAPDLARSAARIALAIRDALPAASVAMVTGNAVVTEELPIGEVVDRACALLARAEPGRVEVDAMTRELLGSRFVVTETANGHRVEAERDVPEDRLLGRASPFLGRNVELGFLQATLAEARHERSARGVVIVGPPGIGKSRLQRELVTAAADGELAVWTLGADPIAEHAPLGLAARLVRAIAGIGRSYDAERAGQGLDALVARHFAEGERRRQRELLGEVVGAPVAEPSLLVRVARRQPQLMREQAEQAIVSLLRAQLASAPALIVIDDVQWADAPTLALATSLLRELEALPLMLVLTARPEAFDRFPELGANPLLKTLGLAGLSRDTCAKLLGGALTDVSAEDMARLADCSTGNPLFLEELARAHEAGHRERPASVIALTQRRIEALAPEPRRVLRAASIFDSELSVSDVFALLGPTAGDLGDLLRLLEAAELLTRRRTPTGDERYMVRHALIRDAAYAMLTDEDRVLGHVLAARRLEHKGSAPAAAIATHYELGRDTAQAASWFVRAAEGALQLADYPGALDLAERALVNETVPALAGRLARVRSVAHWYRGDIGACTHCSEEAIRVLPARSAEWYECAGLVSLCLASARKIDEFAELVGRMAGEEPLPSAMPRYVRTLAQVALPMYQYGLLDLARALLARIDQLMPALESAPEIELYVLRARATAALHSDDPWRYLRLNLTVLEKARAAELHGPAAAHVPTVAYAYLQLGQWEEAERYLDGWAAVAPRAPQWGAFVQLYRGLARMHAGDAKAALSLFDEAVEERVDARMEAFARLSRARVRLELGDREGALCDAERSLELAPAPDRPVALAMLALTRSVLGEDESAAELAARACAALAAGSLFSIDHVWAVTICVRVLGRAHPDARSLLEAARACLRTRAERIEDEASRAHFLNIAENRELLAEHQ